MTRSIGQGTSEHVAFDPKTRSFGPMKGSVAKKVDQMNAVSARVSHLSVPTDYASPTFLSRLKPAKLDATASPIHVSTQGVKPSARSQLLNSVRAAQRSI